MLGFVQSALFELLEKFGEKRMFAIMKIKKNLVGKG